MNLRRLWPPATEVHSGQKPEEVLTAPLLTIFSYVRSAARGSGEDATERSAYDRFLRPSSHPVRIPTANAPAATVAIEANGCFFTRLRTSSSRSSVAALARRTVRSRS